MMVEEAAMMTKKTKNCSLMTLIGIFLPRTKPLMSRYTIPTVIRMDEFDFKVLKGCIRH